MQRQLKYNEVRLAILAYAADAGLHAGDKLPPERELLKSLDCSIATVRSALQTLADEGFIRKVHGVGSILLKSVAESPLTGSIMLLNIVRFQEFEHVPLEGLGRIRAYLRKRGLGLEYVETPTIDSEVIAGARNCLGILLYSWAGAEHVATLRALNLPIYLIGNVPPIAGVRQIRLDLAGSVRQLTLELIRRGCRRIALVNAPENVYYHQDLLDGFQDALKTAGLPWRDEDVIRRSDETFRANLDAFAGRAAEYDAVVIDSGNLFPFLAINWQRPEVRRPQLGIAALMPETREVASFVYSPENGMVLSVFRESLYLKAAELLTGHILSHQPLKSCLLKPELEG